MKTWIIIPAAGTGARFQSNQPKQYTKILNKTIIEYAIEPFLALPSVEKIIVALSATDTEFSKLPIATHPKIKIIQGGESRAGSVFNGLQCLKEIADENDWVLVHDAARALILPKDIQLLINQLSNDKVGGILAKPNRDTLKKVNAENEIETTIDRENVWLAETPQMFRYGLLSRALLNENHVHITDEASAIEALGLKPKIVESQHPNFKLTLPSDLNLFEFYLYKMLSSSAKEEEPGNGLIDTGFPPSRE